MSETTKPAMPEASELPNGDNTAQAMGWIALGVNFIGFSLASIILGHLSLARFKKQKNQDGRGVALAGTIVGYVFTVSTALFFAFVFVLLGLAGVSTMESIDTCMGALETEVGTCMGSSS